MAWTTWEEAAMRPVPGLPRALTPEEVLVLREKRAALRAAGLAVQSLLAERTNASALDPARVEEARRRLAAAEREARRAAAAAEKTARRSAKRAAQRLRKAARGGDASAEVKPKPVQHWSNTGQNTGETLIIRWSNTGLILVKHW